MNRDKFEAFFRDTAKPWLIALRDRWAPRFNGFHQAASDYAGLHPWAFWVVLALAGVGTAWIIVKVIGWAL